MASKSVIGLCQELEKSGIIIWLDGGWGVDAQLGEQTRSHNDLDIFIQEKDVSGLRGLLEAKGYHEIKLETARPFNFVLGDDAGHEIDVHVIVFESEGEFSYGTGESREIYPVATLGGTGSIEGRAVKCISPEWMVRFHTGYTPREQDFRDVSALCRKFGMDLPEEYTR